MPAPADVRQLLLQVEASVAVAQRNVNQLANAVTTDSTRMEKALDGVASAHNRLGNSLGQQRAGYQQLSFQISDVTTQLAGGQRAATIFAQQAPQIVQAITLMRGSANGFMSFLAGPWGAAVIGAAGLLGVFYSTFAKGGKSVDDAVKKLREHYDETVRNAEAQRQWERSFEGITDKLKKETEEIDAQNRSLKENTQLKQQGIEKDIQTAQNTRSDLIKNLNAAQGDLAAKQRNPDLRNPDSEGYLAAQQAVSAAQQRVTTLTNQVAELNKQITAAGRASRELGFSRIELEAKALADPIAAINMKYDDMRDAAEKAAASNQKLYNSLKQTLAGIEKQRDAALKAQRATSKPSGEGGRQIDFDTAAAIARGAGMTVNSGPRTYAEQAALYNNPAINRPGNPVARPGHSAHEGVNGKWALDIQFAPGITAQSIRKLYGDQGVSLSAVYKEKGHYHIEGSRSKAAAAEALGTRQDDTFEKESTKLDRDLIDARNDLNKGIIAQAVGQRSQLEAQQQVYNATIDAAVREGRLKEADGELLKAKNDAVVMQKEANITKREALDLMIQEKESESQQLQGQIDHLQALAGLTDNDRDRAKIQDDIIDLMLQIKENAAAEALAAADLAKDTAARARIEEQLRQDRQAAADAHNQNARNSESPLTRYMREAGANVDRDFQQAGVRGLESLTSNLADATLGVKSLKAAFKDLKNSILHDLLEIAYRETVIVPLAKLLFGDGSYGGGGGAGGVIGAIGGFLGTLFAGGGAHGSVPAGVNSYAPSGVVGPRAIGGPVGAGLPYLVGERGPEIVVPSQSGVVIPNGRLNQGQSNAQTVHVVVDTSEDLTAKAVVVADQRIQYHEPRIVNNAAMQTLRAASRPKLRGR